ncbi:GlxA family transcriptional regulator [Candidatus Solirubrobacter pratensis]|uniref:GlxA family transcriptional regulator n=1 Tax=Candidatus Solirubrobacter pratensis TaxID=1298857 RepID=UPI0004130284|nr:DJ-1/PfpI family protein [Candidatus Solirubrobacter pratensis]
MRTVALLAYDGVQLLDLAGPIEVFDAATERGGDYRLLLASPGGRDVRAGRTRVGADGSLSRLPARLDTLIVPGAPAWRDVIADRALVQAVAGAARRSRRVASVCAGAFLLAAAGLLDGRRAATHWELADDLAREFPAVEVDADAIFVADGGVYTSAGITAGIDLCLALVEADHGAELAREVARHLVVFMQRPGGQAQFSARLAAPLTANPTLRRVLDGVAAQPAGDHSLPALSERAGFSVRHLTRVFRREVGLTPGRYVERVRVEAAKARLQQGDESLAAVARAVGFGSEETMRRAFRREAVTTPADYRDRFRTTGV